MPKMCVCVCVREREREKIIIWENERKKKETNFKNKNDTKAQPQETIKTHKMSSKNLKSFKPRKINIFFKFLS